MIEMNILIRKVDCKWEMRIIERKSNKDGNIAQSNENAAFAFAAVRIFN